MTAFATVANVLMKRGQKRRRGKNIGGIVTDTAIVRGRDVIHLLRGRDARVMTGRAIVHRYTHVVKNRARKGGRGVTNKTILGGR